MKKLLFISLFLIVCYDAADCQTVIPKSTTVYDFGKMKNGFYQIITPIDTMNIIKDSSFCVKPTPPPTSPTYTIFTNQPYNGNAGNDGQGGIELGIKFRASVTGFVTGIRFYKHSANTGIHIGELYTSTGIKLGQATFTGETQSGWQTVLFISPIPVDANRTYVAAYYSPNGTYTGTANYFTAAVVNGPISGLASGIDGNNGVYKYTATPAFPTSSPGNKPNYWVDVMWWSGK